MDTMQLVWILDVIAVVGMIAYALATQIPQLAAFKGAIIVVAVIGLGVWLLTILAPMLERGGLPGS